MRKIKLTQNQYALVDDEDFDKLNCYKWCASYSKYTHSFYTVRAISIKNGEQKTILMHRIIMDAPRKLQVDHINHNTLDNRKQNLRLCTHRQNILNQKSHKVTSSKYKGVYLNKHKYKNIVYKYWKAQIVINGEKIYLGYFKTENRAAKAYDKKAKELFGKFALTNFKIPTKSKSIYSSKNNR